MATSKSALKRVRQSEKRRQRNKAAISAMKTVIKKVHTSMEKKDPQKTEEVLREATSYVDRVASKGIIHKNKASRIVSRLTARARQAAKKQD